MKLLDQVSYRVLDVTLKKRMKDHKAAFMCLVDGQPGAGKSYWTMAAAEYLDSSFSIDNICFTTRDFIKRIESADPHDVLIYDESGNLGARDSQSKDNKNASLILEMIRWSIISQFYTIPDIHQIDVNVPRLATHWCTAIPFDRSVANPYYKVRAGVRFRVVDPTKPSHGKEPGWVLPEIKMKVYKPVDQRLATLADRVGVTLKNTSGITIIKDYRPKGVWLRSPSEELLKQYQKKKEKHFYDVLHEITEGMKFRQLKKDAGEGK